MCKVEGCIRPVFANGRCGFHALQGYYRTTAAPGARLTATRVRRPPRVLGAEEAPEAERPDLSLP